MSNTTNAKTFKSSFVEAEKSFSKETSVVLDGARNILGARSK